MQSSTELNSKKDNLGTDNSLNINPTQHKNIIGDIHPNKSKLSFSSSNNFTQIASHYIETAGNTLNTAFHINLGTQNGTYADAINWSQPNKYYAFDIEKNSHFSLSVHTQRATLDVQVLNSKGEVIPSSTNTGVPPESVSLDLPTGTYYLKIYPETPITSIRYELDLSATQIPNLPSPTAAPSNTPVKDPLLGVYYGNQGWNMDQVKAMESWQGKKDAVVNMFTNWANDTTVMNNLFTQQLPNIWNNQNVPMITWEPFTSGSTTPNNIDALIANGQYDAYINNWADQLKTFLGGADKSYNTGDDRRAYIRLGHEMNGNWYPWSPAAGGSTPQDYKNMWIHVKTIFDNKGLDTSHVQWVWCVNNLDVGGYNAQALYPGDAYVNWVAIDGYNWGNSQTWSSWQTPNQVFDPMINSLKAFSTRPIAITEVGSSTSTSYGTSVAAKSQWMNDFFNYAVNKNVKMVSWFNEDKETDWAAFGGTKGDGASSYNSTSYNNYSAYKTGITPSSYSGSDPTNPRLLTDTQFSGLMA